MDGGSDGSKKLNSTCEIAVCECAVSLYSCIIVAIEKLYIQ
jgi:hypothetical protein